MLACDVIPGDMIVIDHDRWPPHIRLYDDPDDPMCTYIDESELDKLMFVIGTCGHLHRLLLLSDEIIGWIDAGDVIVVERHGC